MCLDYGSKLNFFFDLDGTLVNSSPLHDAAFQQTLKEFDPSKLAQFLYQDIQGRSTSEALGLFLSDPQVLKQASLRKQQLYRQCIMKGDLQFLPGALDLLKKLKKKGLRCFLCTGGSRESTRLVLKKLTMQDFFEGVFTSEDVLLGKPAPDLFLAPVLLHGLDPQTCLCIEDAASGVESAIAARLDVVQITSWQVSLAEVVRYRSLHEFSDALFKKGSSFADSISMP